MRSGGIGRAGVTVILVALAILAFAGNSLFARAALIDGAMGAGSFSAIRLAAGALVLLPFLGGIPKSSDAPGGIALAAYAIFFAFAYRSLPTATGALILFASVQATILLVAAARGERPGALALLGVLVASAGLAWLFAPGAGAPDAMGAVLMLAAGIAWGFYTLIGRAAQSATRQVATSFVIGAIIAAPFFLIEDGPLEPRGVLLAILSGAITSGLGYVAWYMAAPRLGIATVAAVQLSTPVAAAILAWPLIGEAIDQRLLVGGALVLGGIVLTLPIVQRPAPPTQRQEGTGR